MHIGQTNPSYSDPLLEAVDIRQIYDKFPEKKGGLKELYERGPQNSFFLVKFWVCCWEGYGGEGHPQATGSLWVGDILGSSESWCPSSLWRAGCGGASWDPLPLSSLQADLNSTIQDGPGTFYGVSSQYSSAENMTITVSTKVCSFGKQVVEKVEVSSMPRCIGQG